MSAQSFRAVVQALRLHCGPKAIEEGLLETVKRAKAKRAFVVCSRSVAQRTDTVRRIAAILGELYAGAFDGIEKDSTFASVCAAKDAALAAGADLLIAVGGGSVMVATRVVAIYLAESDSPFKIMTQYPEGKPAYSPRLLAPKLPIVNIPTTPTSAMHRSGAGLKNPDLDHRMEYFDPKTRPQAIFLDEEALLSAPESLMRSTATTVFAANIVAMSQTDVNPLSEASRNHAFKLAYRAYSRLNNEINNPVLRQELAIAALLQDRAEDDGMPRYRGGAFAGNYSISTALHVRYPHVGQGESTSVLHATKIRLTDEIDAQAARQVADALGVWHDNMDTRHAALAVAEKLEEVYSRVGVPTRLRQIEIPKGDLQKIADETVKNFNFNPGQRSVQDQIRDSLRLLEAAY